MNQRVIVSIILLLFCIDHAFAQNTKKGKETTPVLFSVGKRPVYTDEFLYLFQKNNQSASNTRAAVDEYLELFVNFKLKVRDARERGMDTTRAFVEEYNSYKRELLKPYLPDNKILDSLILLTYERRKEEVRASHILISLKENPTPEDTLAAFNQIVSLRERAVKGEDFGSLASLYSQDPSAKQNKGDLGFFTAQQMVFPFENAAYTTPVGKISELVRTRFGYHILKVEDRRPSLGEVEVSHIMIVGRDKSEEAARDAVFEVQNMLRAGAEWDEVCRQYSQDPNTKETGGRLRPFGVGEALAAVPTFQEAAFALQSPGDISDPVKTVYGWHIIRLEKKIPLPPLDEMKSQLRSSIQRDERYQISREAQIERFKRDLGFTEYPVKDALVQRADSSLISGNYTLPKNISSGQVLFTIGSQKFTVRNFQDYIKTNQSVRNFKEPSDAMNHLYTEFVKQRVLELAEQKIAERNPDYRLLSNEYYEGILLFSIMEQEVWNKAAKDSVGQVKYYEANADKYKAGERMQATLFFSKTSGFQDSLALLIEKGDSLAIQKFVTDKNVKVQRGRYQKGENEVVSNIPWEIGTHKVESNGFHYFAWISKIVPPGIKGFSECRAQVITDYQNEIEQQWISSLKKKYRLRFNEKGRQHIYKQLSVE